MASILDLYSGFLSCPLRTPVDQSSSVWWVFVHSFSKNASVGLTYIVIEARPPPHPPVSSP